MKKILVVFVLIAGISSAANAMGHFHRSPHHHGHHHQRGHLTTIQEQKPAHKK